LQRTAGIAPKKYTEMMHKLKLLPLLLLLVSCYNAERNCKDFKTGTYQSEITIKGVKHVTTSIRTDSMVIETYKGKTDTASIRWINDCEYVLQKRHPKTMLEKKAIDIKILTTSKNSYTFEFGVVGNDQKQRGTAVKM
jgi:hypothetical protein